MWRTTIYVVLAFLGAGFSANETLAQRNNPARRTANYVINRPTVSPYLNLLMPQGLGMPNYQTLVRPAIDQRRQNQDTQRQISQLQSFVAESNVRDQRGETTLRPTGHTTGYFYYSHFYPTLARKR